MNLPPLPEAAISPSSIDSNYGLYTHDQMREYGQKCYEQVKEDAVKPKVTIKPVRTESDTWDHWCPAMRGRYTTWLSCCPKCGRDAP